MNYKIKYLKLLETPKANSPQMWGESRNNELDGIRLNPKCINNGQSAAKLALPEGSQTLRGGWFANN